MKFVDTYQYHFENPGEPVERYGRRKRIELAHEIRQAKKIYLDTKFWLVIV